MGYRRVFTGVSKWYYEVLERYLPDPTSHRCGRSDGGGDDWTDARKLRGGGRGFDAKLAAD